MHKYLGAFIFLAVFSLACSKQNKGCRLPRYKQLLVDFPAGKCQKKWCPKETTINLSCKNSDKWELHGPTYATCEPSESLNKSSWKVDRRIAKCLRKTANEPRDQLSPMVSLRISSNDVSSASKTKFSTTMGSAPLERRVRCEVQWPNHSFPVSNWKSQSIAWYDSNGNKVSMKKSQLHAWSEYTDNEETGIDLNLEKFEKIGTFTYVCKLPNWSPEHHAKTVEIEVRKVLCSLNPFFDLPCNTHIFGKITEANLTVTAVARIWPNEGYIERNGKPLESVCTSDGEWDPPFNHLNVDRVRCLLPLNLSTVMKKSLVDGPEDDRYQTLYKLSCNETHTLIGNSLIYCNSSGHWFPDLEPESCKRKSCGDPPSIPGVSCKCPNNLVGVICPCKCAAKGYKFTKGSIKELQCLPTGWSWSLFDNKLPTCTKEDLCQCKKEDIPKKWKREKIVQEETWNTIRKQKNKFCKGEGGLITCKSDSSIKGKLICDGNSWKLKEDKHTKCS